MLLIFGAVDAEAIYAVVCDQLRDPGVPNAADIGAAEKINRRLLSPAHGTRNLLLGAKIW